MDWDRPKAVAILLQSHKSEVLASNNLCSDPKLILQSNALHLFLGYPQGISHVLTLSVRKGF